MTSYCQLSLSFTSYVRLFFLHLPVSLPQPFVLFMPRHPSLSWASQVSPVEPNDKLRLLTTRCKKLLKCMQTHPQLHPRTHIHPYTQTSSPSSLFQHTHWHTITHSPTSTHTQAHTLTHSWEVSANREGCWVREWVVVSSRRQSRSKEEVWPQDFVPELFTYFNLLKKRPPARTLQIRRLPEAATTSSVPFATD